MTSILSHDLFYTQGFSKVTRTQTSTKANQQILQLNRITIGTVLLKGNIKLTCNLFLSKYVVILN